MAGLCVVRVCVLWCVCKSVAGLCVVRVHVLWCVCKSVAGLCVVSVYCGVCVSRGWSVCGPCVCSVVCVCVECVHTPTLSWWLLCCRLCLEWDGPVTRVEVCVAARGFLREGEVGPELSELSEFRSHPGSPQCLDPRGKEALEPRPLGRRWA